MESKKRKTTEMTETTKQIEELSKQIKEESGKPEDAYLNPSESEDSSDEDYSLEDDEEEEDDEISEIVQDFQHKMYNDNQRLNKKVQTLKVENERLSKKNHYLQLSHNNERVDKLEAWKKIKLQLDILHKKNQLIKQQKRLLQAHIIIDLCYIVMFLEYMGFLPYIIVAIQRGCIILYNACGTLLLA